MEFTITTLLLASLGAFLIGMAKAGLKGIGAIIMTIMALVFGAKASTGIVLLLLIAGDILAVIYYKRSVDWKLLLKFMPYMAIGIVLGAWVGKDLDEETFKFGMAIIILLAVAMMFWNDMKKDQTVPTNWLFGATMGLGAGFTTMIGNLAGAFSNLFFLAMRVSKTTFIGTAAMLYFIMNLFKVPFHYFSWGTIDYQVLLLDLKLLPALFLGFYVGLKTVDLFKEDQYRKFILVMTAVGAILILLK